MHSHFLSLPREVQQWYQHGKIGEEGLDNTANADSTSCVQSPTLPILPKASLPLRADMQLERDTGGMLRLTLLPATVGPGAGAYADWLSCQTLVWNLRAQPDSSHGRFMWQPRRGQQPPADDEGTTIDISKSEVDDDSIAAWFHAIQTRLDLIREKRKPQQQKPHGTNVHCHTPMLNQRQRSDTLAFQSQYYKQPHNPLLLTRTRSKTSRSSGDKQGELE